MQLNRITVPVLSFVTIYLPVVLANNSTSQDLEIALGASLALLLAIGAGGIAVAVDNAKKQKARGDANEKELTEIQEQLKSELLQKPTEGSVVELIRDQLKMGELLDEAIVKHGQNPTLDEARQNDQAEKLKKVTADMQAHAKLLDDIYRKDKSNANKEMSDTKKFEELREQLSTITDSMKEVTGGIDYDNMKANLESTKERFNKIYHTASEQLKGTSEGQQWETIKTQLDSLGTLDEKDYIAQKARIDSEFDTIQAQVQTEEVKVQTKVQQQKLSELEKLHQGLDEGIKKLAADAPQIEEQSTKNLQKLYNDLTADLKTIQENSAAGDSKQAAARQTVAEEALTEYETAIKEAQSTHQYNAKANDLWNDSKKMLTKVDQMEKARSLAGTVPSSEQVNYRDTKTMIEAYQKDFTKELLEAHPDANGQQEALKEMEGKAASINNRMSELQTALETAQKSKDGKSTGGSEKPPADGEGTPSGGLLADQAGETNKVAKRNFFQKAKDRILRPTNKGTEEVKPVEVKPP